MHEFLSKALEDKSIVWFKASNSYIILEEIAAQLVHQILENKTPQKIASVLAEKLTISEQEATTIIKDLSDQIVIPNTTKTTEEHTSKSKYVVPSNFAFQKHYQIHTKVFKVQFSNEFQLFDLLTQDISTNPPTFLEHYHFKTLLEVNKEIENQMSLIN